jgi:hypothetical protein
MLSHNRILRKSIFTVTFNSIHGVISLRMDHFSNALKICVGLRTELKERKDCPFKNVVN